MNCSALWLLIDSFYRFSLFCKDVHCFCAGILDAASDSVASTVLDGMTFGSITNSVAGVRPKVVNFQTPLLSSCATQSTPLTETQGSVVGPGTSTPQRRTTCEGSPQALVACEEVGRRSASPMTSGSTTIISAHFGLAASGAASTDATDAQEAMDVAKNPLIRTTVVKRPNFLLRFDDSSRLKLIFDTL